MNLQIGKVKNYNNKILISSPSFKIGTNLKINLDGKKDEPDVKPKGEGIVKTKPDIEPNKNANKMLNLTSSLIKKANLIRIRSPMRKKGSFGIGNNSCLYSMVDVQMTTFSLHLS